MKLARNLAVGTAVALVAVGCENDTLLPSDALTEEESVALFNGMAALVTDTALVPVFISPDSIVVACPQGGQARLLAVVVGAANGDTVRTEMDATITPNGCVVSHGGLAFTTGGDPDFRYRAQIEVVGLFENVTVTGSVVGGLTWQLGTDRSGSCAMDLTLSAEPDLSDPADPKLSGTLAGKLCDHDVEVDASSLVNL